ncbi:Hypothetical protein PBC10988_17580 [Planctomycetales bacterium 10988]|nr:Hypothetical protein PBC10988_17580 [Planctomycetales bacterium 10988]
MSFSPLNRREMLTQLSTACAAGTWLSGAGSALAAGLTSQPGKSMEMMHEQYFITWRPKFQTQSIAFQPEFESDATKFGLLFPAPSKPISSTLPSDLFVLLGMYTQLDDISYRDYDPKSIFYPDQEVEPIPPSALGAFNPLPENILRPGAIATIPPDEIEVQKWFQKNRFNYGPYQAIIKSYIDQGWFLAATVIDVRDVKRVPDNTFMGVTRPIRLTFATPEPVVPLRISQPSASTVIGTTYYIVAPEKMDFAGEESYQTNWQLRWSKGYDNLISSKRTGKLDDWLKWVKKNERQLKIQKLKDERDGKMRSELEFAKAISISDLAAMNGRTPYRGIYQPIAKEMSKLRSLLASDYYMTKIYRAVEKKELNDSLKLQVAQFAEKDDPTEYSRMYPIWKDEVSRR